ncbi:hypothetical protein AVEN_262712-1 [Araneus ventricosus]|uniref:Uncharacterized protein n=1 Tax=Araneus ventricosus TaxID=182803 RepID=A0A4Y2VW44_ARAVE|nr:hypothetical protein AVEN_262712-1 [Araneus ventricosus]
MTSRYQCTKLFTEKLQKKRGTYPYRSMDSIALLSRRQSSRARLPHCSTALRTYGHFAWTSSHSFPSHYANRPLETQIHFLPGDRFLGNIVHSSPGHLFSASLLGITARTTKVQTAAISRLSVRLAITVP